MSALTKKEKKIAEPILNAFGNMALDHRLDACLIAAAPDLLEACRAAYRVLDTFVLGTKMETQSAIVEQLSAAIDKATGWRVK